jgi:Kef-type K+ transport system membrane component KefB
MHDIQHDLLALLILVTGSFLMPVLSTRIRVPSAVLLIGYGLLVGPNVLHLVSDTAVVGFLFEIGFIILMFLAGLEIDFNGIRQRGLRAMLVVIVICGTIFGLAFVAAALLGLPPIFGLALGATSVGLPLAVLGETGQLRTHLGQMIVLVGSVGEFLSVVGMTLFYFAVKYGFSLQLVLGLGKLIAMLAIAGLILRALMAMAWWRPESFSTLVAERDGSELGVRAALLLMVGFSLLALLAGLESIIGAFVAGALIAFVLRGKEVLEEKLAAVGHGLFVPVFFVVVGMRFAPQGVTQEALGVAGKLLVATFIIRLLPCLGLLTQGLRLREVAGVASLLSAPLTLVVAIAALGSEIGSLDSGGASALIILAVSAGVVYPIVFRPLSGGRESPVTE